MSTPARRRPLVSLAIVGLGAAVAPLDFAVNVAFPAMTAAFALETRAIRWVAVCYVLSYGSLMLAFGALGDRVGHLRMFRAGLLLGAVAFTLCAVATDFSMLLAARVLQGVAVALTLSCAPALVTLAFAETGRTRALAGYAGSAALAGVVAPLAGGLAMQVAGWAGVYWMRVPVVLVAFALTPLVGLRPAVAAPGRFDARAAALLAAGLAALLLAPALAGPGGGPAALGALAVGATLFLLLVRGQRRSATPFLPAATARDAGFWLANLAHVVVQFCSFAVPLLIPYYVTQVAGWGSVGGGALLSAWAVGMLGGASLAPRVVGACGTAGAAGGAALAATLGLAAIAAWPAGVGVATMAACLALQGAGLGLYQVAYTDQVVAALPESARGFAGSLTMVTRTMGVVLGASGWIAVLAAGQAGARAAGAGAVEGFMTGFGHVFVAAAAICVLAVLPALRGGSSPAARRR